MTPLLQFIRSDDWPLAKRALERFPIGEEKPLTPPPLTSDDVILLTLSTLTSPAMPRGQRERERGRERERAGLVERSETTRQNARQRARKWGRRERASPPL